MIQSQTCIRLLAFLLLGVSLAHGQATKLDRPAMKALAAPMYFPGAGIQFSRHIADDIDYLNPSMLRMEFIGEADAGKTINYPAYDYIVDTAGERGLAILGLIDYQSVTWSDQSEWATQAFRDRYVARTQEIVGHFAARAHPIKAWEIWNEPDIQVPNFNVRIEPEPYARLLIAAYTAIKAIDPDAVVLFGGISPKGFEYSENYLNDVYASQPMQDYFTTNGHYPFDVVAVHPYPEIFTAPNPGLVNVLNNRIKAVMNSYGDRFKKVWLTEMGWSSFYVTENQQANYLRDSFHLLDDLVDPANPGDPPYVEKYFWFYYTDFSNVDRWGLYTQGRTRQKPAYSAYLALTDTGPIPPDDEIEPGEMAPVWNGSDDGDLPFMVSPSDVLNGRIGSIDRGGFHEASQGTVADMTDGSFDTNPVTLVLFDYGFPSLQVTWTFDEPMDLSEVRIFAGHFGDSGNRAFQSNDVLINGTLARSELNTGNYGQVSEGNSAVSVVQWLPPNGEQWVARDVETLSVIFWCSSSLEYDFRDRWSPVEDPQNDYDGLGRAYVSPIIKEVDAFGVPSRVNNPDIWIIR